MKMDVARGGALVTGGGSGLGRGIALALGRAGYDVLVADLDLSAAQAVAKEVAGTGRKGLAVACDVSDPAAIARLADHAFQVVADLRVVFNNAGVVATGAADAMSEKDVRWMFEVNVFGMWFGSTLFAKAFVSRGVEGWICNTASENGLAAASLGTASYTATKHAVLGLTDALRAEYAGRVGFSVICPGIVRTRMWDAGRNRPEAFGGPFEGSPINQTAMDYGMDPEEAGRRVVAAFADGEFFIFTHRHVIDLARRRWMEIEQAAARQFKDEDGEVELSTVEIQRRVLESLQAPQP